ncbi:MAG: hypothetical protein ABR552_04850, partial [Actinomycetota bacterium]
GGSVAANATAFTGLSSQATTEGLVQQLFPVTQTFTKFYCFGPKPTSGTSDVFTLRVNGADTTATCTVGSGVTTVVLSPINISISGGSLVDVKVVNGNTAGGVTWGLAP